MVDTVARFAVPGLLLGGALAATLVWLIVVRARARRLGAELAALRAREAARVASCARFGHHLDEACLCTRCLTVQHDGQVSGETRTTLRSELISPNADPGALYLDSNFQPDPDYGRTQTVYQVRTTMRCARCGCAWVVESEWTEADSP